MFGIISPMTLTLTLWPLRLYPKIPRIPYEKARKLVGTRGETTLGERVVSRLPGPVLGQLPPTKYLPGRQRLRHARNLKSLLLELQHEPCTKGDMCNNECAHISDGARTLFYEEYRKIRLDVRGSPFTTPYCTIATNPNHNPLPHTQMKNGAKYRGYSYLFQFMKKVKRVKHKTKKHKDSYVVAAVQLPGHSPTRELIQHCVHCQYDARDLWNPQNDHIYDECRRRREVQHGSYYVKQLHLLSNGIYFHKDIWFR